MRRVLIVIDMQHDFIDGALGTEQAMQIVPNVIQKIRGLPPKMCIRDSPVSGVAEAVGIDLSVIALEQLIQQPGVPGLYFSYDFFLCHNNSLRNVSNNITYESCKKSNKNKKTANHQRLTAQNPVVFYK